MESRHPAAPPRTRTSSRGADVYQIVLPVLFDVCDFFNEIAVAEDVIARHIGANVEVVSEGGSRGLPGSERAISGQGFGLRWQNNRKSSAQAFGRMQMLAWTRPAAKPAV